MKDRFKTRIWHKETKTMHYNDFVISSTGYAAKVIVSSDCQCLIDQSDLSFDKNCVVMQCTGLKDINGNLIYEGDLHKTDEAHFSRIFEVFYNEKISAWALRENGKNENVWSIGKRKEPLNIIGNIYENLELLKDGEND